ncbi:unnamed protein product [Protopolystoma xenopodis]|uniref:Uncharacterized protein n=1 Tax=Protopolystoma xenopodis TaxID=117903 RepID=A0A3S5FEV8_9PLAT|nr:unnamed protein product [Protopolystoma xenopodis]
MLLLGPMGQQGETENLGLPELSTRLPVLSAEGEEESAAIVVAIVRVMATLFCYHANSVPNRSPEEHLHAAALKQSFCQP